MFHFDEAHKEEYRKVDPNSDVVSYFTLAIENNQNLEFWTNVILEHKKMIDVQENDSTPKSDQNRRRKSTNDIFCGENHGEESEDSHLEDSDYEGPVRKKLMSTTTRATSRNQETVARSLPASSPPPCMLRPPPTPPTSVFAPSVTPTAASRDGFIIKSEPSEDDCQIPAEDLVQVFVGRRNDKFDCSRHDLAKSAVLTRRITTRDGGHQHSFIMDPSFVDIDPSEFCSVVQFLNLHEYEPLLLHSSDGKFYLDDSIAPIDYPKDLLRSAKLFNLAKRFQLPVLADLIFRKVLHGHPKYDVEAFLSFASTILKYQEIDFSDDEEIKGVLEDWIIKILAENMDTICSGVAVDAKAFWRLMRVRGVELKVMGKRVELCKMFPGGRVKIED
jgi:hypothetical protein